MRFAIVASALFAGLVAAAPAITETVHSTAVETITSCGPEVTNCPARSASAATSAPVVPTSAPVVAAVQNTTAPAAGPSTVTLYSTQAVTITSCGPEVTNCPARTSQSSWVVGTTVIPVNVNAASSSAPFAMKNSTATYQPTGTGAVGTGVATASTVAYTGAASTLGGSLAFIFGAAAIALI